VSLASFYRWRSLLGAGTPSRAMAAPAADSPTAIDFVDLGALREAATGQRIDLRLDLGGGLSLHLVRS
jgi:putative transposase